MTNIRLSNSKIGSFDSCQWKYKLSYIDKIRSTKTPEQLKIGIEVHDIFDLSYKENSTPEELEKWIKSHKKYDEYKLHLDNFLNLNKHLYKFHNKIKPEYAELKLYNEEWNFVGIIDRVDVYGDKVIMIDYKTGKEKQIKEFYQQLASYVKLFEDQYGKKVTHWGIFFSKTGGYIIEKVKPNEVVKADSKIHKSRSKILTKMSDPNAVWAKNTWLCRWCSYYPDICNGKND